MPVQKRKQISQSQRRVDREEKQAKVALEARQVQELARERAGEVLAVGPGGWDAVAATRIPMECKPGDVVWFLPGAAVELSRDDGLWSLHEGSVLAVKDN